MDEDDGGGSGGGGGVSESMRPLSPSFAPAKSPRNAFRPAAMLGGRDGSVRSSPRARPPAREGGFMIGTRRNTSLEEVEVARKRASTTISAPVTAGRAQELGILPLEEMRRREEEDGAADSDGEQAEGRADGGTVGSGQGRKGGTGAGGGQRIKAPLSARSAKADALRSKEYATIASPSLPDLSMSHSPEERANKRVAGASAKDGGGGRSGARGPVRRSGTMSQVSLSSSGAFKTGVWQSGASLPANSKRRNLVLGGDTRERLHRAEAKQHVPECIAHIPRLLCLELRGNIQEVVRAEVARAGGGVAEKEMRHLSRLRACAALTGAACDASCRHVESYGDGATQCEELRSHMLGVHLANMVTASTRPRPAAALPRDVCERIIRQCIPAVTEIYLWTALDEMGIVFDWPTCVSVYVVTAKKLSAFGMGAEDGSGGDSADPSPSTHERYVLDFAPVPSLAHLSHVLRCTELVCSDAIESGDSPEGAGTASEMSPTTPRVPSDSNVRRSGRAGARLSTEQRRVRGSFGFDDHHPALVTLVSPAAVVERATMQRISIFTLAK